MNTYRLKGNWNIIKGKIKQLYSKFSDDDRLFARGIEEELIGRYQVERHTGREQIIDAVGNL
jgi:uncharacterized protein YjbJ (UPF0337 family)